MQVILNIQEYFTIATKLEFMLSKMQPEEAKTVYNIKYDGLKIVLTDNKNNTLDCASI